MPYDQIPHSKRCFPVPIVAKYRDLGFLGYPNYRVGSDGSIWSKSPMGRRGSGVVIDGWKKLSPGIDYCGYSLTVLCNTNGKRVFKLHRLVLEAFIGPCPEGMICRHLDGNPGNNLLRNLCWGTRAENEDDKRSHGTFVKAKGQDHGMSKLTDDKVRRLRDLHRTGKYTNRFLSSMFDISESHCSGILKGKAWAHIK